MRNLFASEVDYYSRNGKVFWKGMEEACISNFKNNLRFRGASETFDTVPRV